VIQNITENTDRHSVVYLLLLAISTVTNAIEAMMEILPLGFWM